MHSQVLDTSILLEVQEESFVWCDVLRTNVRDLKAH